MHFPNCKWGLKFYCCHLLQVPRVEESSLARGRRIGRIPSSKDKFTYLVVKEIMHFWFYLA